MNRRADSITLPQALGAAIATGFVAIAVFQVALALGDPFWRAAWDGANVHLPMGLRVASAFAACFWALAAPVVLARSGLLQAPLGAKLVRRSTWALSGVPAIGSVLNFASRSELERFTWGPITLTLAVLLLFLSRSKAPTGAVTGD